MGRHSGVPIVSPGGRETDVVRLSLKPAATTIRIVANLDSGEIPPAPTWDPQHPFTIRQRRPTTPGE
ncbi:MAG: hypothetical protein WBY94_10655 [Polyangiaceae bacterium]